MKQQSCCVSMIGALIVLLLACSDQIDQSDQPLAAHVVGSQIPATDQAANQNIPRPHDDPTTGSGFDVTFAYPGGIGQHPDYGCEVGWSTPVVVAFNRAIDVGSVTPETFRVGIDKEGHIEVCGNVIVWKPELAFNSAVMVTVVVSAEIEDVDGNPLGEDYEFLFCTEVDPS